MAWPFEGLKLVSGLSKSGPLVDLKDFKLVGGLSKSGPLADLKLKGVAVDEDGPSSSKDFWWAGEEENNTTIGIDDLDGESSPGPSQLPLVDRAQNVMAHSPAWSGLRNWGNSKLEFIKLWVTEGMRKQLVEEQQIVERSKTDQALVEEALKYVDDFVSWG